MKRLSRRERAGVGIILIAVLALAVDRLVLPPPKVADAAAAVLSAASPEDADLKLVKLDPDRFQPIQRAVLQTAVPDIFSWERVGFGKGDSVTGQPKTKDSPEVLLQEVRVQGIILGPRPAAILDGHMARVGDTIHGHHIVSIDSKRVILEDEHGRRRVLPVPVRGARK